MATIATLSADLKDGRPGARVSYVLEFAPWHKGDAATTTIYAASTPVPPDVPGEVWPGLRVGTISQGLTSSGGLMSLIFGATSLDLATLEIPGMHRLPGVFHFATASLKGAVADGAESADVDGIPATARIEMGTLFRIAGQDLYAWHVVTETATASGGSATIKFWPPCPGGWSDNARILERVGEPIPAPSDAVVWQGFNHENRTASLYALGQAAPAVGVDQPADRVAWADRKTLISGARIAAPAIDTGDQSPGLTLPLHPPGDRLERSLTLPSRGLGVLPIFGGGLGSPALPAAYWFTSTASPTVVNPDLGIYADVFVPQEMEGETARKFLISTGERADATDNGWGMFYLPTTRIFGVYIHLNGTAYSATTSAITRLEGWYTVFGQWDASAAALRIGLLEWDDIAQAVTWSSDTDTGADTYTKGPLQMTLGHEIQTAGVGAASKIFAGLMSLTLFSTLPATAAQSEELMRRGPRGDQAPYEDTGGAVHVCTWGGGANDMSLTGGGPSDPYVWYAHGPTFDPASSPTSAFEATEQADLTDLRGDGFGGGSDGAGTFLPFPVGKCFNVEALAVSQEFHALALSAGRLGPVDVVRDNDVAQDPSVTVAAEPTSMLRFQADDPDSGKYSIYYSSGEHAPPSLVRFADDTQPTGRITADLDGASCWGWGLYFNGTDARADLPAAGVSAIMGAPFAWSLHLYPLVDDEDDYIFDNIDTAGGATLIRFATTGSDRGLRISLAYDDGATGASDSNVYSAVGDYPNPVLEVGAFGNRPHHLLMVADEPDGSTIEVQLFLNGRALIDVSGDTTWTITGGQLGASTTAMRIGASLGAGNWATMIVNEPAVFDYVPTAAERDTIRLTADLAALSLAKRPEHYYPDPRVPAIAPTVWTDAGQTGSQNGTITNAVWGKPVPTGDLSCATAKGFSIAGVTGFNLLAMLDLPDASVGFPMGGEETCLALLDRCRFTGVGWLVPVLTTGTWTWYTFEDWSAATPDITIRQGEILEAQWGGVSLVPPKDFGLTYLVLGTAGASAPGGPASILSSLDPIRLASEYRTARIPVPGAYTDHAATEDRVLLSGWVDQAVALERASEVAALLALTPSPASITDRAILEDVNPGMVAKVFAPGAPGGVAHILITDVQRSADRRTIKGLALPV